MQFKAAILTELNAPLEIAEVSSGPLECGQVLVKVHATGICGAQLGEIAGSKGPDRYLPHMLGHEGGGTVVEVGPGVRHVKPGDHVVMHWRKGVGIDSAAPSYTRVSDGAEINGGWVNTFCEYAVISENRLTAIDADVPFEIAALMGCAVTTALGIVNNLAKVKIGQSVAVLGCGGVGLNVVQAAAMVSADPIIAVDIYESKLEMARQFGATHTIDSSKEDVTEAVRAIVGSDGVDVFVENTGQVRLIEQAYEATAKKGRVILVGVPRHDQDITIHSLPLHFGRVLTGCEGGETDPSVDIPRYLRLYKRGKLDLDRIITHRMPFERINEALDMIRAGEVGRCVLDME